MTRRIVPSIGVPLIFLSALCAAHCQMLNDEQSASIAQPEPRGKGVFETRCATCHGLDGLGGEHAPDVVRGAAVKALSEQALLNVIHDGIPQGGMPGFSDMGKDDLHAVVGYLRFLQGDPQGISAGAPVPGDPTRGQALFTGKAGCSACHQLAGQGSFMANDLAGFAKNHTAGEIREAMRKPPASNQEIATAVARDGRTFSGMIRNEDNASLQLQDGDGRLYLLMKSSLTSLHRKAVDSMPADYGHRLTASELDDLVAYIVRETRASDVSSSSSGKDEEFHDQD